MPKREASRAVLSQDASCCRPISIRTQQDDEPNRSACRIFMDTRELSNGGRLQGLSSPPLQFSIAIKPIVVESKRIL